MTKITNLAGLEKLIEDSVYQEILNIKDNSFSIAYKHKPYYVDGEEVDSTLVKATITFTVDDLAGERDYSIFAGFEEDGKNRNVKHESTRTKILLNDPFDKLVNNQHIEDFFKIIIYKDNHVFNEPLLGELLSDYPREELFGSRIRHLVDISNDSIFVSLRESIEDKLFVNGNIVAKGFLSMFLEEGVCKFFRDDRPSFSLTKDKKNSIVTLTVHETLVGNISPLAKTGLIDGVMAYNVSELYELCAFVYGLKGSYISEDTWDEAISMCEDITE